MAADSQKRPAMTEAAAAAIHADVAHVKPAHNRAHKAFTDSARGEINGYHDANGAASGDSNKENIADASHSAKEVGPCPSNPLTSPYFPSPHPKHST